METQEVKRGVQNNQNYKYNNIMINNVLNVLLILKAYPQICILLHTIRINITHVRYVIESDARCL